MKMNYFVFGTNNMVNAIKFYDDFFENTEIIKIHSQGRMSLWAGEDFLFGIAEPYDGNIATNGNGTMLGLNVNSAKEVYELFQKALSLGGTSEGNPDLRSNRYCAYVRDLDLNKICIYK